MLSSQTVVDDGGYQSTIQGLDQHSHSSPSQDLQISTTSTALHRQDSHFNVENVSPKNCSPLRHSVSYNDSVEIDTSPQNPRQLSRDPWTSRPSSVYGMSFTGDKRSSRGGPDSPKHRAPKWWTSGPPTSGGDDLPSHREPASPKGRGGALAAPKSATSTGGFRIPFFSSSNPKDVTLSPAGSPDDEFMNMDLESALFPGGIPNDKSAFSPAAFKNLQMAAIGLLTKYQNAYQQRTTQCLDLQADCDAQAEEKEEVETRVYHLKMQLEEMAHKATERENTMQSILQELAQEKRARQEEHQMVREKRVAPSEASGVSEDLGVEDDMKRRSWRKSGATSKSDLSLDTDEDSVDEVSIFSRSRSPTICTTNTDATCSPIEPTTPQAKTSMPPPPRPQRPAPAQMTTFQKLIKGISGEGKEAVTTNSCNNCQGQDASIAWDAVSLLRDENKGLKQRVGELETAVEGALDAVHGLGL